MEFLGKTKEGVQALYTADQDLRERSVFSPLCLIQSSDFSQTSVYELNALKPLALA